MALLPLLHTSCSQPGADCPSPQGHWRCLKNFFGCHNWRGLLPTSRGQGCHSTSCNAQDRPPRQRTLQPTMSLALKVRNPALHNSPYPQGEGPGLGSRTDLTVLCGQWVTCICYMSICPSTTHIHAMGGSSQSHAFTLPTLSPHCQVQIMCPSKKKCLNIF